MVGLGLMLECCKINWSWRQHGVVFEDGYLEYGVVHFGLDECFLCGLETD